MLSVIHLQFLDYKGNSPMSKTIMLESFQYKPDAEQARAKGLRSIFNKLTNNGKNTRSQVCPFDERDECAYTDAVFRIGKV